MMKHSRDFLAVFILLATAPMQRADDIPGRLGFDRYAEMMDRSPFAVATAAALPTTAPDFAKDLYVANAARSSEGDMVTIASTSDVNFKKYLSTKEPVDGYGIASIEWSDRVGETKVTISKDGKFATLGFNEALLEQQQPPNLPPNLPPPGANFTQRFKPAPIPTLPTPPAHVRGMIPRKPQITPMPPNGAPPEAPPPPAPLGPES
jgi:hypothetical protein